MILRHDRHGFTLVEVLIVVVILGILATVVLPMFRISATEARESTLRMDLASLRTQIHCYHFRFHGSFPSNLAELQSAVGTIPRNPYTNATGVRFVTQQSEVIPDENQQVNGQKVGWFYHPQSGGMWANCEGTASNGQPLISL